MRRRSTALFLAAVLALGGSAVACGDSGTSTNVDASPVQRIRAASEKTIEAGSSKMFLSVETTGDTAVTFEGEGAFDYESRKGLMTLDTSSLAAGGFPKELEMRLDGDIVYMNLGSILPGGKPWAKIDITKAGELGSQFASLSQLGTNNDPSNTLAFVEGVSDDVKTVGKEKVRGTDTTHYSAVISLDKAVAAAKTEDAKAAIAQMKEQMGVDTVPGEFWLDAEGRVRRYRSTIDLSTVKNPSGEPLKGSSTTTMELFDFGTKVDVKAPPADQTTDLADLLKGMGGTPDSAG